MMLLSTMVATAMACAYGPGNTDANALVNSYNGAYNQIKNGVESVQGSNVFAAIARSSSGDETLSNKWQREKNLKQEMMAGITHCLTTRNRPMEKSKQRALEKTDWFTAWDTHCSNQIDLNCPIKAGECWAMGVITCRKNCDAKFLLRGNRGKFKRCIYKQMKAYEKDNTGVVSEQCSVFSNTSLQ